MSRIKILPFIILLFFATQNQASEPAAKNGLVPYVSDKLQTAINKLFHYLKINKNFRYSYKIKLLLIMYENLYNVIEYNWKIFSNVKNSVIVRDDIKNNYLLQIVNEALQYNNTDYNDSTKAENITVISTEEEEENASAEKNITSILRMDNKTTETTELEDLDKFTEILENILDKINKLPVNDFIGEPLNKTYLEYKAQKRRNFDLKTWDPNEYPDDKVSISRRMAAAELIKQFPFVASVHVMEKLTCAGSIISKHGILTTASCLPFSYDSKMIRQMPDIIKVRVGSDYANDFGELVPILDVEFHPQYNPKTLENNLAIIRLNKLHKYAKSRPKIRKIRLDDNPFGPRSYTATVQILGFGAGNDDLKQNEQRLAVTNINMIPMKQCQDIYTLQFVNQLDFCASFTSRRNNICHGDVGAPGVADGYLVGMVSFGPPVCGKQNAPTVFIKIGAFADWINSVINQKWIYPPQSLGSPVEFMSTRLMPKEEKKRTFPTTPRPNNIVKKKQNIFQEIKAIVDNFINSGTRNLLSEKENDDFQNPLDFIFGSTTTSSVILHPLLNKSILPIPGVHYTTRKTSYTPATRMSRPDIGLPDDLPYDYINSKIKDSEELDYFIQMLLKEMVPREGESNSKMFLTKGMLWQDDFYTKKSLNTTTKPIKSIYVSNYTVSNITSNERNSKELKKEFNDKTFRSVMGYTYRFPRVGIEKIIGRKLTKPLVKLLPGY